MSATSPFNKKAADLRHRQGLSILALAEQTNTAKNNIYWAEGSHAKRTISVRALRHIYRDLCRDEEEWIELLTLWAIDKDGNRVRVQSSVMNILAQTDTDGPGNLASDIARGIVALNVRQRALVLRVVRSLPQDPTIEKVLAAYLEPIEPDTQTAT